MRVHIWNAWKHSDTTVPRWDSWEGHLFGTDDEMVVRVQGATRDVVEAMLQAAEDWLADNPVKRGTGAA